MQQDDYYILPDGRLVFTATYLLKRGWCCGNGCVNCPYDYINVAEPQRTELLVKRAKDERKAH
ncbi:MAG: hypothetical protein H0X33_02760 [Taibaiella sp.]|nr:hypothetical protein [Taibaiella sp.]